MADNKGPKLAYRRTECEDCADLIEEGEPIYFTSSGRICATCAQRDSIVCPLCKGQKKPEYETCWRCSSSSTPKRIKVSLKG